MLCLDPTFDDGSRPLRPVLDELADAGYELELVDSEVFDPEIVTDKLRRFRLPTLHKARHLAVVIRA